MLGGRFGGASTVITNASIDAVALPSLTLMMIPAELPTSPAPGVPESSPVRSSKLIQADLFRTE
jgi:hypothetical protein